MDAEIAKFDEASEHPYECRCTLCREWWNSVPDEDDQAIKHCDCGAVPDENEKGGSCSSCGGHVEDEPITS